MTVEYGLKYTEADGKVSYGVFANRAGAERTAAAITGRGWSTVRAEVEERDVSPWRPAKPVEDVSASCRTCGAPIVWALTDAGKRMPIDPDPVVVGHLILERRDGQYRVTSASPVATPMPKRWVSHFATCPQAGNPLDVSDTTG